MAIILIIIIILIFYSGWFLWPLLYYHKVKKYNWTKATFQAIIALVISLGIGTGVSDLIVASNPNNRIGIIFWGIFLFLFPYVMLFLSLHKNKTKNS